jgi:hypothetical protein
MISRRYAFAAVLFLYAGTASAQAAEDEPLAVVELGVAPSRSLNDHSWSFGPTAAVEVTPIEKWLELEAGVTRSFSHQSNEWATDLLLKKPWTLSSRVEVMAGVGPEWIHSNESGRGRNSVAGEAALDFMIWPGRKHKLGWYFEPAYDYSFGPGHEQSLGISFGLLIAIPKRSPHRSRDLSVDGGGAGAR